MYSLFCKKGIDGVIQVKERRERVQGPRIILAGPGRGAGDGGFLVYRLEVGKCKALGRK